MLEGFDPDYLEAIAFDRNGLLSGISAFLLIASVAAGLTSFTTISVKSLMGKARQRERLLEDLIPLHGIVREDGCTLVCKDGRIAQVIQIDGADIGSLDSAQIDMLDSNRESFFSLLQSEVVSRSGGDSFEIKFFAERSQRHQEHRDDWPEDQPVMSGLGKKWAAQFKSRYESRFYLIISIGPREANARERLEMVYRHIETSLEAFSPRRLGRTGNGPCSLIAFWNRWLNGGLGELQPTAEVIAGGTAAYGNLNRILGRCEIGLNTPRTGLVSFTDGEHRRYCQALEIRRFANQIDKRLFLDLQGLEANLRILLQISILSATEVQIEANKRNMIGGTMLSPDRAQELAAIKEDRDITWAEMRFTIFVLGDTLDELNNSVDAVRNICANGHFTDVTLLGAGIDMVWQALFPGRQWIRTQSIMPASVLAEFMAVYRADRGLSRCDFGDGPVTMFPTQTGDAFNFTFHNSPDPEAPGHTMMIGATGLGKTFLIEWLISQTLRYRKVRCFIFDAFMGTYVCTNACGGHYWSLEEGEKSDGELFEVAATLNPLQMKLSPTNSEFLVQWLSILGDVEGLKQDNRDLYQSAVADIRSAVRRLPNTNMANRSLAGIYQSSFGTSALKEALEPWVDVAARGKLFNGKSDSLDLDSGGRVVAFDMTTMREDKYLLKALMPYLIHRIRRSVTETKTPYLMVFEETAHMLRIPSLATFLVEELQQARKRHGVAIMAFQEPGGILKSDARDAILQNTFTQIFIPNPGAEPNDYAGFGLKEHEFAFIRSGGKSGIFRRMKRPVLIRKRTQNDGWTSVIVDVDLSAALSRADMALFKSGSDYAEAARHAISSYGRSQWVSHYVDLAAQIDLQKSSGQKSSGEMLAPGTFPL